MLYTKVNDNLYLFQDTSYFDVMVGVIILPNKIAIIDTGISTEKMKEFREYVEKETNKKCELVFITHSHGDHFGGIQAFVDCRIIISEPVPKKFEGKPNLPVMDITNYLEVSDEEVTIIFKQTGGHSKDSSYVYCSDYKILFAGDNLFENMFPYGQDPTSNPEIWIETLEEYLSLNVDYYIPGHQNICTKGIIRDYIEFIKFLKKTMSNLHSKGKTKEEILTQSFALNPFDDTKEFERLKSLKTRTLENWYTKWVEKKD